MRHIDELTEEKFTLQRCLEQQTGLADRLAEDNEALTKAINSQAGAAEAARAEVQEARQAAEEAKAQASAAAAERDSYALAAREAADRAKVRRSEDWGQLLPPFVHMGVTAMCCVLSQHFEFFFSCLPLPWHPLCALIAHHHLIAFLCAGSRVRGGATRGEGAASSQCSASRAC